MSGIRTMPHPSKYIVDRQFANGEKFFSGHFKYERLLEAAGGTVNDYTDLTEFARGFYARSSQTLSENTAPFIQWLKGTSGTKDIQTRFARWRHYGKPRRKFISLGDAQTSCEYIGAAGSTFKFRVDANHFVPSDQLAPTDNGRAIVIIESMPRAISGGFEYDARLLDADTYLPSAYLKSGSFWTRAGQSASYLSAISGQAGSISFNTGFAYIEWEVPMHTMTKEYQIDMETHLKEGSLKVGCKFDDEIYEFVTNKIEIEFEAGFEREMEHLLIHGTMTRNHIDPLTKKSITTAPGLYAYLDEANIINYNPFVNSIDMIIDLIKTYWYDRVPVSRRSLVLLTGQAGLELWHNWILEKFGKQPIQIQENFVLKTAKAFDPNKAGYEFGNFQFTRYSIQPFGSVSVGHWPMLDDTLFDTKRMPGSIYTVRSHEFIAMDWGMGDPNVQLLRNTQRDRDLQVPGYWSSYGPVGINNPYFKTVGQAELGDSYKVRRSRTFGLAVLDVSRVLLFRPSV